MAHSSLKYEAALELSGYVTERDFSGPYTIR